MLDRSLQGVDPLSDILALLKPRNVACGAIDSGDACISFPAAGGVKCHAVVAGEAWLEMAGVADPVHLTAGTCFILPHGHPYRIASDLRLPPIDYRIVIDGRSPGKVTVWNGGGRTTIISATFSVEAGPAKMLLGILPPIAKVDDDIEQPTLRRSLLHMMQEFGEAQPGSRLIIEHLAAMMLAQTLRAYSTRTGNVQIGWLFALADPRIGPVIGAMHGHPAHAWTLASLARRAAMSRTGFAVRFKHSVGVTPMIYLTQLRVLLASDRLSSSDVSVAVVAEAFGYASESAFSAAFKRHLGRSPRQFTKLGETPNRSTA